MLMHDLLGPQRGRLSRKVPRSRACGLWSETLLEVKREVMPLASRPFLTGHVLALSVGFPLEWVMTRELPVKLGVRPQAGITRCFAC